MDAQAPEQQEEVKHPDAFDVIDDSTENDFGEEEKKQDKQEKKGGCLGGWSKYKKAVWREGGEIRRMIS